MGSMQCLERLNKSAPARPPMLIFAPLVSRICLMAAPPLPSQAAASPNAEMKLGDEQ